MFLVFCDRGQYSSRLKMYIMIFLTHDTLSILKAQQDQLYTQVRYHYL